MSVTTTVMELLLLLAVLPAVVWFCQELQKPSYVRSDDTVLTPDIPYIEHSLK